MTRHIMKGIVVDDDQDDLDVFLKAARSIENKIDLLCFQRGEQVLDFLNHNKFIPDFIFLDINMPVMDGQECLKKIRQRWHQNERCVIMYSTSNDRGEIKKYYELGANAFMQKPHSFAELKNMLQQIFNKDWSKSCENLSELDFILSPEDLIKKPLNPAKL